MEALRREARQVLDDGFEVFFDRHDLRTREEWRTQLAWAVREAEVLMACVSTPYFESDFCLWEFQGYEVKPTGPDTGGRVGAGAAGGHIRTGPARSGASGLACPGDGDAGSRP